MNTMRTRCNRNIGSRVDQQLRQTSFHTPQSRARQCDHLSRRQILLTKLNQLDALMRASLDAVQQIPGTMATVRNVAADQRGSGSQ